MMCGPDLRSFATCTLPEVAARRVSTTSPVEVTPKGNTTEAMTEAVMTGGGTACTTDATVVVSATNLPTGFAALTVIMWMDIWTALPRPTQTDTVGGASSHAP